MRTYDNPKVWRYLAFALLIILVASEVLHGWIENDQKNEIRKYAAQCLSIDYAISDPVEGPIIKPILEKRGLDTTTPLFHGLPRE